MVLTYEFAWFVLKHIKNNI